MTRQTQPFFSHSRDETHSDSTDIKAQVMVSGGGKPVWWSQWPGRLFCARSSGFAGGSRPDVEMSLKYVIRDARGRDGYYAGGVATKDLISPLSLS